MDDAIVWLKCFWGTYGQPLLVIAGVVGGFVLSMFYKVGHNWLDDRREQRKRIEQHERDFKSLLTVIGPFLLALEKQVKETPLDPYFYVMSRAGIKDEPVMVVENYWADVTTVQGEGEAMTRVHYRDDYADIEKMIEYLRERGFIDVPRPNIHRYRITKGLESLLGDSPH